MKQIWARHFTELQAGQRRFNRIVLHATQGWEKATSAEDLCAGAAREDAPKVSWHFASDSDSLVQAVRLKDIAYAAPGANADGIHIEIAGRSEQTLEDWSDLFSELALDLTARLVAELCALKEIPIQFRDAAALVAGLRGITTHAEVSKAFKKSDHWDPGPNFPMKKFMETVANYSRQTIGVIL